MLSRVGPYVSDHVLHRRIDVVGGIVDQHLRKSGIYRLYAAVGKGLKHSFNCAFKDGPILRFSFRERSFRRLSLRDVFAKDGNAGRFAIHYDGVECQFEDARKDQRILDPEWAFKQYTLKEWR